VATKASSAPAFVDTASSSREGGTALAGPANTSPQEGAAARVEVALEEHNRGLDPVEDNDGRRRARFGSGKSAAASPGGAASAAMRGDGT
jgi:hypothetical protein